MNFKVHTDHRGFDSYGGEATCWRDGGVLNVQDGERHIVYSPSGWVRIEADEEIYTATVSVAVEGKVGAEPVFVSGTGGI